MRTPILLVFLAGLVLAQEGVVPAATPIKYETSEEAPPVKPPSTVERPPKKPEEVKLNVPKYNPHKFPFDKPKPMKALGVPPLSTPGRWLHTVVQIDNNLWVWGGVASYSHNFYNDMWMYNEGEEEWEELQASFIPPFPPSELLLQRPEDENELYRPNFLPEAPPMRSGPDQGIDSSSQNAPAQIRPDIDVASVLPKHLLRPTPGAVRVVDLEPMPSQLDIKLRNEVASEKMREAVDPSFLAQTMEHSHLSAEDKARYAKEEQEEKEREEKLKEEEEKEKNGDKDDEEEEDGDDERFREYDEVEEEVPVEDKNVDEQQRFFQQSLKPGQPGFVPLSPADVLAHTHHLTTMHPEYSNLDMNAIPTPLAFLELESKTTSYSSSSHTNTNTHTNSNSNAIRNRLKLGLFSQQKQRQHRRDLPVPGPFAPLPNPNAPPASAAPLPTGISPPTPTPGMTATPAAEKSSMTKPRYIPRQTQPTYGQHFVGDELWQYDLSTKKWALIPKKTGLGEGYPQPRWLHSAVNMGGRMVVFGGVNPNSIILNDIWIFNPATKGWLKANPTGVPILPREGHTAVVVGVNMLVFGGISYAYLPFNDLWLYLASENKWARMAAKGSLPAPRWMHTAVLHTSASEPKRTMYVFGGMTKDYVPLDDLWALDVESFTWSQISSKTHPPFPRYLHSMALNDDTIFLFGGSANNLLLEDFWRFEIKNGTWEEVIPVQMTPFARMGGRLISLVPDPSPTPNEDERAPWAPPDLSQPQGRIPRRPKIRTRKEPSRNRYLILFGGCRNTPAPNTN